MEKSSLINFEELYNIVQKINEGRVGKPRDNSYTLKLMNGDISRLLQKIGEEGVEVVIAGMLHDKNNTTQTRQDLINELCDLFYHSLVLLARNDIKLSEIFTELHKRNSKYD